MWLVADVSWCNVTRFWPNAVQFVSFRTNFAMPSGQAWSGSRRRRNLKTPRDSKSLTRQLVRLRADTKHVEMVLRDLGLEKASPLVTIVAKRHTSESLLLLAGAKLINAVDTTLHRSVKMRINNLRNSSVFDATFEDVRLRNRFRTREFAVSFGSVLQRRPRVRSRDLQVSIQNGSQVESTLVQTSKLSTKRSGTQQR